MLSALEDLANAEADAARHFHRHVASQMVPIVVALLLAVLTVVGVAAWLPDYGAWVLSPSGQLLSLAGAGLVGLICAPMFGAASATLKT